MHFIKDICFVRLNSTTLWANSTDDKLMIVFTQKIGFHISCKLSPKETICRKCQNLFSGKNKTKFFKMSAEIITQHAKG